MSGIDSSLPFRPVGVAARGRSRSNLLPHNTLYSFNRGSFRTYTDNCPSLALIEMKVLLLEVYSRFTTRVAPDMVGSMDIDDQIISSRPKDQTCRLVFTPVKECQS